jgi:hypothetical protein
VRVSTVGAAVSTCTLCHDLAAIAARATASRLEAENASLRDRLAALEAKEALSAASWKSAEREAEGLRARVDLLEGLLRKAYDDIVLFHPRADILPAINSALSGCAVCNGYGTPANGPDRPCFACDAALTPKGGETWER